MEQTPYYNFIATVDKIDMRDNKNKEKRSYSLHVQMGYQTLFHLFRDGKSDQYLLALEKKMQEN